MTNNTIARRPQGPFSDLLDWLESEVPYGLRRVGVAPSVPVEDFVEGDQYVVRAELPGVDPDKDVTVTIENDVLTIHGERREEKKDKNLQEHRYGSFTRAVRVPAGTTATEVKATYANGILEVRVPVKDAKSQAQQVAIERAE
jgi:HSP20 family protein